MEGGGRRRRNPGTPADRLKRQVRLLGLLQAGSFESVEAIARECGVNRRTIFRDLNLLRAAGMGAVFQPERKRYRVDAADLQAPSDLTLDEAFFSQLLCFELGRQDGLPYCQPAATAAVKLQARLPQSTRQTVQQLLAGLKIYVEPGNSGNNARTFGQLVVCIHERRSVRLSIASRQPESTRLDPYLLFHWANAWQVAGRSSLHRAFRVFTLAEISQCQPLPDHFRRRSIRLSRQRMIALARERQVEIQGNTGP
jgi:predicted DNA-binding transcriptional regulator YafY